RLLDVFDLAPDQVAGDRRPAGAVDPQDDGGYLVVLGRLAKGFDHGGRTDRVRAEQVLGTLAGSDGSNRVDDGDLLVGPLAAGRASRHRSEELEEAGRAGEVGVDRLFAIVLDIDELALFVLVVEFFAKFVRIGNAVDKATLF